MERQDGIDQSASEVKWPSPEMGGGGIDARNSSTLLPQPNFALLSHVGPVTMTMIHKPTMKKPACAKRLVGQ